MREIKKFSDGSILRFGHGNFDGWCVFYFDPDGNMYVPKDEEYFSKLKAYGECYGSKKVYDDFVKIYNRTTGSVDNCVLKYITKLSESYNENQLDIDILFTILYMAMIAEENKKNTVLRKRIKRLGIHQLLLENYTPEEAASFSCGMKAAEIEKMCVARGF